MSATPLYAAILERGRPEGGHWRYTGPTATTAAPPYGLSEADVERIYLDSVRGGPTIAEAEVRFVPKGAAEPLRPELQRIATMLESMRGGRQDPELEIRRYTEKGFLRAMVTGRCSRCADRMQVAIDGRWVECRCAAMRVEAERIDEACLPADTLDAAAVALRDWRYGVAKGAEPSARIDAAKLDAVTREWFGQVVRREPMETPLLFLGGAYRAGKSWLAQAMGLRLCRSRVSVRWRSMPSLMQALRADLDGAEATVMALGSGQVGCLILDDLGAVGEGSEWALRMYEGLIEPRVRNRWPTIITTNLSRGEDAGGGRSLASVVGARLAARMVERMLGIGFGGPHKEGGK